jgi:hypothetical protein
MGSWRMNLNGLHWLDTQAIDLTDTLVFDTSTSQHLHEIDVLGLGS